MKLAVSDIQTDRSLNPRGGIDQMTVESYAAAYEQLPPVDVFWIEGRDGWWLVDGWHRLDAASLLGLDEIEAIEHQGTFDEAREFAYDANLKHGRPLTTTERKEAAKLKLIRHTEHSDAWIAQDCGVDQKTVTRLREQMESAAEIPQVTHCVGRDGKKYRRKVEKPKVEAVKVEPVKVYHGDLLKVLPKLNKKFDLIVADPPYNVTEWSWDKRGDAAKFLNEAKRWLKAIQAVLAKKYHFFWFCSPSYVAPMEKLYAELGLPIKSRIVWHRRNMAKGSKAKEKFVDSWEMILHSGNKPLNFPEGWTDAWFDVQIHAVPQTNFDDRKLHPTQKPYSLIRRLVEFGCNGSGAVLDPFAGAGTTGAACKEDDRPCVLVEKEDGYVGIIEGRLQIKRSTWA